jgi:hypothetical protein
MLMSKERESEAAIPERRSAKAKRDRYTMANKAILINTSMLLGSLLGSYVILEYCALLIFFHFLPLGAYPLLEEGVPNLLRATKQQLEPRH